MPWASRSFSRFARALLYRAGPANPPVPQARDWNTKIRLVGFYRERQLTGTAY